jgi:LPXTG-motif cell wall-anchored protein
MVVRPPGISLKLKEEMKSMATKKSRLVIAFILILTMVSFFSIPASVFASDDENLIVQTEETTLLVQEHKDKDKEETKTYTVTYNEGKHGDFNDIEYKDLNSGSSTPAAPTSPKGKDGYVFTGWSPTISPTVTEDVTYKAQWEKAPKEYTVTYNMGGGDKSTKYIEGSKVYIANYEGNLPNGKAFTGWKLNGNDSDLLDVDKDYIWHPGDSFNMPDNNLNFKAQFCDSYNLTINYVYVGGATAATTFVASHIAGDLYSVLSPVKPGFTASQLLVSGTMPATNVAITVTYTANFVPTPTYDLTINYIYVGGASAATSHTTVLAAGVTYSVTSPSITGFTPDLGNISGTMPASNVTRTVTYTANFVPTPTYDLTINYIYVGGSSAATSHTAVLESGVTYSVTSPSITGFTPDLGNISGTMPASNVTRTVTYYANSTEPNTFTITYVALEGGSISGTSIQHLASGLTTSEVTAIPATGYHFVSWNDSSSTPANRSDVVSADVTYTATFEADVVETTTRQTTRSTPDVPVILEPELIPAGPVVTPEVVLDEPVPAAPLPKTGGLDPSFLYGLGALLAGSGLVIKRRKDK